MIMNVVEIPVKIDPNRPHAFVPLVNHDGGITRLCCICWKFHLDPALEQHYMNLEGELTILSLNVIIRNLTQASNDSFLGYREMIVLLLLNFEPFLKE